MRQAVSKEMDEGVDRDACRKASKGFDQRPIFFEKVFRKKPRNRHIETQQITARLPGSDPAQKNVAQQRSRVGKGRSENEPAYTLGCAKRRPLGDHPAVGKADEMGAVDLQIVQQAQQVVDMVNNPVGFRALWTIRAPLSSDVIEDNPVSLREEAGLSPPRGSSLSEAAEKHDGKPPTGFFKRDSYTPDFSETHCRVCTGRTGYYFPSMSIRSGSSRWRMTSFMKRAASAPVMTLWSKVRERGIILRATIAPSRITGFSLTFPMPRIATSG